MTNIEQMPCGHCQKGHVVIVRSERIGHGNVEDIFYSYMCTFCKAITRLMQPTKDLSVV